MFSKIILFNLISTIIGSMSFSNNQNCNLKDGGFSTKVEEKNEYNLLSKNSDSNYLDFKTAYFDGLRENFNRNVYESCGYVGVSMLLFYYDTYLSDNIVPEKYENPSKGTETDMTSRKNSPGGYIDSILAENYIQYYKVVSKLGTPSLQGKLMQIACDNGVIDFISSSDKKESPFLTSFDDRKIIMTKYFENVLGYEYGNQYTFSYEYEDNDSVKQFTINEIQKGNPVLLSGVTKDEENEKEIGHVVIAYEYKDGVIYCHSGLDQSFSSNFYHINVEDCFETYRTGMVINFKIPHVCSNNYLVNGKTYCYHDCSIHTYDNSEIHAYCSKYETYNSTKHKAICKCGEYTLRGHAVDSTKIFIKNGHQYANCIDCNYLVDLGSTSVIIPTNNLFITKNGSYVLENGIYVIVKEDMEAYLNKSLSIFNEED